MAAGSGISDRGRGCCRGGVSDGVAGGLTPSGGALADLWCPRFLLPLRFRVCESMQQ